MTKEIKIDVQSCFPKSDVLFPSLADQPQPHAYAAGVNNLCVARVDTNMGVCWQPLSASVHVQKTEGVPVEAEAPNAAQRGAQREQDRPFVRRCYAVMRNVPGMSFRQARQAVLDTLHAKAETEDKRLAQRDIERARSETFVQQMLRHANTRGLLCTYESRQAVLDMLHAEALTEDARRAPAAFVQELQRVGRRNALGAHLAAEVQMQVQITGMINDLFKMREESGLRASVLKNEMMKLS